MQATSSAAALRGMISYFSNLDLSSVQDVLEAKAQLITQRNKLKQTKIKDADYNNALFHLQNLIKLPLEYEDIQLGAKLDGTVTVYIERDPLRILQMGRYFKDSCLAASKEGAYSTVANAIDANNAVVYAEYNGEIIGRKLLKLSDDGKIISHRSYTNNYAVDADLLFNIFTERLANEMKTEMAQEGSVFSLTLTASQWYDDGQTVPEYFFGSKMSA